MYKEVGRTHKLYFITDGKWRKCGDRIERNVKYIERKVEEIVQLCPVWWILCVYR